MDRRLLDRRAFRRRESSTISKVVAAILGIVTTGASFFLLAKLISNFISNIHVSNNSRYWAYQARTLAYDVCYDGCNDCLDTSIITEACRRTIVARVEGIECQASEMWWWDGEARYPKECLSVIGETLRKEEEAWKQFWWKPLYLLTLLSIPLGYVVMLGSKRLVGMITNVVEDDRKAKADRQRQDPARNSRVPNSTNSRTPLLAAAIVALVLPPQVQAYACITHPAHNVLFSNPERTIHGVVHGWLSDCYIESYSCGQSCSTSPSSGQPSCDTTWCDRNRVARTPREYVNYVAPRIRRCGFELVDYVPVVVDKRIPNPNIEEIHRVKISVNSFNNSLGLDEGVRCLYYGGKLE